MTKFGYYFNWFPFFVFISVFVSVCAVVYLSVRLLSTLRLKIERFKSVYNTRISMHQWHFIFFRIKCLQNGNESSSTSLTSPARLFLSARLEQVVNELKTEHWSKSLELKTDNLNLLTRSLSQLNHFLFQSISLIIQFLNSFSCELTYFRFSNFRSTNYKPKDAFYTATRDPLKPMDLIWKIK